MRVLKIISLVVVIFAGVFLIVFGEHDDSPGAQFLGLLIALTAGWRISKQLYRNKF